jgi:hypothetical protein
MVTGLSQAAARARAAVKTMAVAGSGLLLSGWPAGGDSPERAEPAAREMTLFLDGPADAPQMLPEGV